MKCNKQLTMVAVALTISLVGCSDGGGSSDGNPDNTDLVNTNQANTEQANTDQANTDQANTPVDQSDSLTDQTSMPASDTGDVNNNLANAVDPALNGTWTTGCLDLFDSYELSTTVISDTTATTTYATYSDSTCSTRDDEPLEVATFSIAFPSGSVETALGTARFIDVTAESFTVGGVPVEFPAGYTEYDIYLVIGDTLYLGLDADLALTPAQRPTQLDTDEPLIRL